MSTGDQPNTPALGDRAYRIGARAIYILKRWPIIPGIIIFLLLFGAAFAPILEPYDPLRVDLRERNSPPSWFTDGSDKYFLGGDPVGRDILSRVIASTRITVAVVFFSITVGIVSGTALGLIAGYIGGVVDEVIMRIVDIWAALPYLLIILTIVVVFGQSFTVLITSLALLSWPGAVRLVRAEALKVRESEYVMSAKVTGASGLRIMWKHIMPQTIHIVIVSATLGTGTLILTESTLSFLGAGVPAPNPSWGSMAADGRDYLRDAWWVSVTPGVAIILVVMAGNFMGDWLRDRLDPTLRQL
ncbi:MAG: ABC transporter permease [Dehalococcoidia bacterium]|jgi:peptide/nickel transport system permease protein|nr:ABC transporter permease [Dehalococcoidia bacterium]